MGTQLSLKKMGIAAKAATYEMAKASTKQKNDALESIIATIKNSQNDVLEANQQDIAAAKSGGLNEAMIDRLSLQDRLEGILADIEQVVRLPDPIGELFEAQERNGLKIVKCRTPIGVLGVIYESRPNVTIDISALAIKSGNCAILRGGSETLSTNQVLVRLIQKALASVQLPTHALQLIQSTERIHVLKMLRMHDSIDLIIPRGGALLHKFCREKSTIPVITGGVGICHLFVDQSADLTLSLPVIINAKTQRPTVCNALDTLLVHEHVAERFIPMVLASLGDKGVSFRLNPESMRVAQKNGITAGCVAAQPQDWDTEWLSLVLGIKTVKTLEEAVQHIIRHSTGHSDGILTQNKSHADRFVKEVDSAAVYINASTRFTDGAQLGLGAEVAISTQKLHARGPMGLRELTSYKWIISGNYAIRD
jgi:glutamate-5-semialdehyde dehydrogenase